MLEAIAVALVRRDVDRRLRAMERALEVRAEALSAVLSEEQPPVPQQSRRARYLHLVDGAS